MKKLRRKSFNLPDLIVNKVKKTREVGFFNKRTEEYEERQYIRRTKDDLMIDLNNFIQNIGEDNVVSVSECYHADMRCGDDGRFTITLFYWEQI